MWPRGLFSRKRLYGDLADEMREHLEEKTEQFMLKAWAEKRPRTLRAALSAMRC